MLAKGLNGTEVLKQNFGALLEGLAGQLLLKMFSRS